MNATVGRRIAIAVLGCGAVALLSIYLLRTFACKPPESEAAFKQRLEESGILARMIGTADEELKRGEARTDVRIVDPAIRASGAESMVRLETTSGPYGVMFYFGGADMHYGIIVVTKGEKPELSRTHVKPWSERVWFFAEVPLERFR